MKVLRTPTELQLLWQARFEREGREVRVLDANGDVESVQDVTKIDYGDPYRSAGGIKFTNELVEFCGVGMFPKFTVALMKHSAALLAGGYGETPEDIVEGFNRQQFFVFDAEYTFVGEGMEPFVGLTGNSACIHEGLDVTKPEQLGSLVVDITVNDDHFLHTVESNEQMVAFLCSTIPVI